MSMLSNQVNALRSVAQVAKIEGHEMYVNHLKAAAETIEELAEKIHALNMERSAAHYNGGWVPCEERLPDEPGVYLVTILTSGGRNAVAINYFYDVGRWWMGDTYQISKVTAWMPLPKPFDKKEGS